MAAKRRPKSVDVRSGYLKVSGGHTLYYELFGNPKGKKVIHLHGGPGYGFTASKRRFFDPRKCCVLFFDQRGCGKSTPSFSTKANNTPALISDINAFLDFLGWKRACIFGGSWGSTLALAYAATHPERISGLVLYGIYLGTPEATRFFMGEAAKHSFPEARDRFLSMVPSKHRREPLRYYRRQMGSGSTAKRYRFAKELVRYEGSLVSIHPQTSLQTPPAKIAYAAGLLEAHYLTNDCFLPTNFILKNASKLKRIPCSIVHGRFDCVCSARDGYRLHKAIRGSKLRLVSGGHSSNDPEVDAALKEEMALMTKLLRN